MMKGERKEERGWGRERGDLLVQMPRVGISGLGKGPPGPRGPPRLQKLLCHPGLLAPSPGCGGLGSHGLGGYLGSRQHKAQPQV